jgi:hypothetical protein
MTHKELTTERPGNTAFNRQFAGKAAGSTNVPRLLTQNETSALLLHFTGDQSLATRLVECAPKAALGTVIGIGTERLLDGMTPTWALERVFEHLLAVGADITRIIEAQHHPNGFARDFTAELGFLDAAPHVAWHAKDIP